MKFNITSFLKKEGAARTVNISFDYLQAELEHYVVGDVREELTRRLVEDLYPSVKNRIMEDKHFQKILNEINLLLASKFIN